MSQRSLHPAGLVLHHAALGRRERTWAGPVPVTTPERPLQDRVFSSRRIWSRLVPLESGDELEQLRRLERPVPLHRTGHLHHARPLQRRERLVRRLDRASEQLALHVDMKTRRVAPFPDDVLMRLGAMKAAHAILPRPDDVGRAIVMRKEA